MGEAGQSIAGKNYFGDSGAKFKAWGRRPPGSMIPKSGRRFSDKIMLKRKI
jgi:hypothetical protein